MAGSRFAEYATNGNYILGRCHYEERDYAKASAAFRKALAGNISPVRRTSALNYLSIAEDRLGKPRAALYWGGKAVEAEPFDEINLRNHIEFCRAAGAKGKMLDSALRLAQLQRDFAALAVEHAPVRYGVAPAPLLLEASIDLKLMEDGRVKIIEFNDLYKSGFDGFKKAYDGVQMREDIVYPWQDRLESEMQERYGGAEIKIICPESRGERLDYLCTAELDGGNIYSSTLAWECAVYYKDYTHLSTPAEWEHMFPGTLVIARDMDMTEAEARRLAEKLLDGRQGSGNANFIIKPCNDSVGRGVELVTEKDIVREILKIASGRAPKGDYWNGNIYPNFLVQECIRSRPVAAANGKLYDGTMRVAFSAVVSPGRDRVEQVQFHGAYWKFPSRPYDHEDARNSVVSFPPTSLGKIADREFAADIPISGRVSDGDRDIVYSQLRPWLTAALPAHAIQAWPFADRVDEFLLSQSSAHAALGVELATSFQAATALEFLCGQNPMSGNVIAGILQDDPRGRGAAARYFNYLARKPIQNAGHAYAIAGRCLGILEPRALPYARPIPDVWTVPA